MTFSDAPGGESQADTRGDKVEGDAPFDGGRGGGELAVALVDEEGGEDEEGSGEAGQPFVHGDSCANIAGNSELTAETQRAQRIYGSIVFSALSASLR